MGKETLLSPESTLQPGNRNPRAGIWHIMVVIHTFASRGSLYMHSKHSHMKGLEDSETKCVCSKHWRFPGLHFNLGVWKHNCMSPKAECHSLCPAKPHTDYNSLQRQHNTHSWVSRRPCCLHLLKCRRPFHLFLRSLYWDSAFMKQMEKKVGNVEISCSEGVKQETSELTAALKPWWRLTLVL